MISQRDAVGRSFIIKFFRNLPCIDAATGDIVLSTRPTEGGWAEFFVLRDKTRMPKDFMNARPMNVIETARDPFDGHAARTKSAVAASARRKLR